jgi:hypothetical protein
VSTSPDVELRLNWLSVAMVALFGVTLSAGTLLHMFAPDSAASVRMLQAGLVLLMMAPAVRILIAVLERVRRRDWPFVLMTAIVLAELAIVLWRAAAKV